jgi:hypothetical protein
LPTYTFEELTRLERLAARPLILEKVTDPELDDIYENGVQYSTNENFSVRTPLFVFSGTAGATYGVASVSHYDPHYLVVYDMQGKAISHDSGGSADGTDVAFFVAPYSGRYYVNASWSQGPTLDTRGAAIAVYEDLDTVPETNVITGTPGDDIINDTVDADIVDGGAGLDTFSVFSAREDYTVALEDGIVSLTHRDYPYVVDQLENIDRIWFTDGYISFETEGYVSEAYRLYQAAFDRKPDEAGLGYWINNMSDGMSLYTVAAAFLETEEFAGLYGETPSDADILTQLYWNILDRAPDQGGFDYWIELLEAEAIDTADLLVAFSESVENTALTYDEMNAGYFFYF